MKDKLKLSILLLFCIILTACSSTSNSDTSPPSVNLASASGEIVLGIAQVDWPQDSSENMKVDDIFKFAEKQKQNNLQAGVEESLGLTPANKKFKSYSAEVEKINVSFYKNKKLYVKRRANLDPEIDDQIRTYNYPKATGDYVMVVNIIYDLGKVKYVGRVNIFN